MNDIYKILKTINCLIFVLLVLLFASLPLFSADDDSDSSEMPLNPVLDIPLIKTPVIIDGDDSDWQGRGLNRNLTVLLNSTEKHTAEDFYPRIKVAWCDKGVLVFVSVMDDEVVPTDDPKQCERGDGIELGLAASQNCSAALLDMSLFFKKDKTCVFEFWKFHRHPEKLKKFAFHAKKTEKGYNVEMLLPWCAFSLKNKPELGAKLSLQIIIRDYDSKKRGRGVLKRAWILQKYIYSAEWKFTKELCLADKASELLNAYGSIQYRNGEMLLSIAGNKALAGSRYSVELDNKKIAAGILQKGELNAYIHNIPIAVPDNVYLRDLKMYIDDREIPFLKNTDFKPSSLDLEFTCEKLPNDSYSFDFRLKNKPDCLRLGNPEILLQIVNLDTGYIIDQKIFLYG